MSKDAELPEQDCKDCAFWDRTGAVYGRCGQLNSQIHQTQGCTLYRPLTEAAAEQTKRRVAL